MLTTKQTRIRGLDQYYTLTHIAHKYIQQTQEFYTFVDFLIIEPSAGNGSFFLQIPSRNKIGLDISPQHESIIQQDFFQYTPQTQDKKILVIGNPPFGRVSSIAVKFFNHASTFATVIAFIVPRTFRRVSIQNRLCLCFHLIHDEDVPANSFDPPIQAKCCFQIWERKDYCRSIVELPIYHKDWEFLSLGPLDDNNQPTVPKGADFAIRAYGGKCGEVVINRLECLRPKSWHWIKSNVNMQILVERFMLLDYSISIDTARQNSIGKKELVLLYTEHFE
jgi:hypothetical protein